MGITGTIDKIGRFFAKLKKIPKRATAPSLTVVVPTHTENAFFYRCIDSLLGQNYPKENLKIIVVVNGDGNYYNKLKDYFVGGGEDTGRVDVRFLQNHNVAAARNYGISVTTSEFISFVDDDDYVTPEFFLSLTEKMTEKINVACGRTADFSEAGIEISSDTPANRVIARYGERIFKDYAKIGRLLSVVWGKVYRTEMLKGFTPMDETLKDTEDVVYFADNFEKLNGRFYLTSPLSSEYYARRLTENSLSRPNKETKEEFFIEGRREVIERLSAAANRAKSKKAKTFIEKKIKAQEDIVKKYLAEK